MPAQPEYETYWKDKEKPSGEAAHISRIMREEGFTSRNREAVTTRPVTRRALDEIAGCYSIVDFRALALVNVAWHDAVTTRDVERKMRERSLRCEE